MTPEQILLLLMSTANALGVVLWFLIRRNMDAVHSLRNQLAPIATDVAVLKALGEERRALLAAIDAAINK